MKIQYKYAVSLTAALALFMAVLDSTIVNVALVSMERDFKTTINAVQWVVTGYILVQAAVIPVTGYFGNRYGVKRVFMLALAVFTVGSLLCGLSPHIATGNKGLHLLIVFRLVQGIGGGMLFPLGTTISFSAFPPAERAASSAVVAIPVLFAPALGPTVGGLIVDSGLKWPGIFFINVPVGIITLVLLARIVRPDERAAPGAVRVGFDYSGLFLSIIGVVLVVYAFVLVSQTKGGSINPQNPNGVINGWGYWLVWALLAAGLLVLSLFGLLELFVIKDPVLDLRLFATRDFRIASIVTWVVRGLVFGSFLLVPIFLQQFQSRSAVQTGLILMGQGIGAIIGIQLGSRLYDRIGPRALTTAGLVILAGATLWLVAVKPDSGARFFVPILFLRGIGFGWSNLPLQTVGLGAITGRALGKATSLYNATAQIFSSIGTALVTTILVQRTTLHASDLVRSATASGARPPADLGLLAGTGAVSDVFKLLTIGTVGAALISLLLPRQSLKQQLANEHVPVPVMIPGEAPTDEASPAPAAPPMTAPVGNAVSAPPSRMRDGPMREVAPPHRGPPPGMPDGDAPARPPSLAPSEPHPSAASAEFEARIAALEQIVVHLMDTTQPPPAAPPSVDEGRVTTLERSVGDLDRLIHTLPPPTWHREQHARAAAIEQRLAALERAVQQLAWGYPSPRPDAHYAPTPGDAPRD